jgi:hypothetical protein
MFPVKFMGKLMCITKLSFFLLLFFKNVELNPLHYGKNTD